MNKVIVILIIILGLSLSACNDYSEKSVKLIAKSSIVDCEEENVHLMVMEVFNPSESFLIGNPILPICENSECESKLYQLRDTNSHFIITGKLSIKAHGKFSYGCIDSKSILINTCERVDSPQLPSESE